MAAELGGKGDERLSQRIAALAGLELLNDPSNLNAVLTRISEAAEKLLPATGGASIILWDSQKQQFYVSASTITGQKSDRVTTRVRNEGGATRWIIENLQPRIVSDIRDDPSAANPMLKEFGLRAYAGFPIIAKGEAIGVIYALDREPRTYTEQDQDFMKVLSDRAASALLNARLFTKLEMLATHDDLTSLYNRRGFLQRADLELKRARRFGHPLSALMIDIDHFKQVNDAHGHAIGNQLLVEIANRLWRECREVDLLGRIGGEEFAIILVETGAKNAREVGERLRKKVESAAVRIGKETIETTISVGVVSISQETADVESLLDLADAALYDAKRQGRNRVVQYGE